MNNTINNDELLSEQSGSQENQNLNSYTAISDQEKRQKMLLGKLSVPPTIFECDEWITLFKSFTQPPHNRFLYSSISATIISESDDTTASSILTNIKKVTDNTQKTDSYHEQLCKFFDHCNLANVQREAYKQTKNDIKNITISEIKSINEETSKNITAQLVSLVAIFTAIAFVLFGGITSLTAILQYMENKSLAMLCSIGIVWAFIICNAVYILMKFVFVLTDRNPKQIRIWLMNLLLLITLIGTWVLNYFKIFPFI